jgi:hypothetical protein
MEICVILNTALAAVALVAFLLLYLDRRGERKAVHAALEALDGRATLIRTDHTALARTVATVTGGKDIAWTGATATYRAGTLARTVADVSTRVDALDGGESYAERPSSLAPGVHDLTAHTERGGLVGDVEALGAAVAGILSREARRGMDAGAKPPRPAPLRAPPPALPSPATLPAEPPVDTIETAPDSAPRVAFVGGDEDIEAQESRATLRARVEAEQDAREKARAARPGVALAAELVRENPVDDDDPPTVVPTGDADDGDRASDGLTKVEAKPATAWIDAIIRLRNDIARRGSGATATEDERKLLALWKTRAEQAMTQAKTAPHPLAGVKPEEPTSSVTRAAADFAARSERIESPTKASAGEPSVEDRIMRRFAALLNNAEDAGEDVAHCRGALCWHDKGEPTPDACTCDCDPCERAKGLYCQARREIAGESLPPPRKA